MGLRGADFRAGVAGIGVGETKIPVRLKRLIRPGSTIDVLVVLLEESCIGTGRLLSLRVWMLLFCC